MSSKKRPGLVSSLSMAFKKATTVSEDLDEVKKEHRETLHGLIKKYAIDVEEGKAEGIRNAKDLVEVMKMDLLLAGDVTDRTENNTNVDEARVAKVTKMIDLNDPAMAEIMDNLFMGLNKANDDEEDSPDLDDSEE